MRKTQREALSAHIASQFNFDIESENIILVNKRHQLEMNEAAN
jgi:hypothetical protein